ncbi:hypothetical protein BRADI_2g39235v3 [Brachypodium distachyon]|uniref:Knottin scorpion toxin-like domain-containing protein n=1 Tax=Brachypodium distachyon TaxID=15368 RepID=A0A2K2DCT5_BRADI|nr:hypothetical protein BRADI_2g39235v3 [Brachypodium distachyon]
MGRTSQALLLFALALLLLSSPGATAAAAEEVVVPKADCSVTTIGLGQPCEQHYCATECKKEHDGMGACAAMGCSCAVCAKYPPSFEQTNGMN